MAGVTLEDCVKQFGISVELLEATVSADHIRDVSKFWDWRRVAPQLIGDSEVEEVDLDEKTEQEKRHRSLQRWQRKFAFKATYQKLIDALLESGRADHAEEVCKMLTSLAPQKGEYTISYTVCMCSTET